MKKVLSAILILATLLTCLAGCGKKDENTIVVGASATPHAEILEQVKGMMEEKYAIFSLYSSSFVNEG